MIYNEYNEILCFESANELTAAGDRAVLLCKEVVLWEMQHSTCAVCGPGAGGQRE